MRVTIWCSELLLLEIFNRIYQVYSIVLGLLRDGRALGYTVRDAAISL